MFWWHLENITGWKATEILYHNWVIKVTCSAMKKKDDKKYCRSMKVKLMRNELIIYHCNELGKSVARWGQQIGKAERWSTLTSCVTKKIPKKQGQYHDCWCPDNLQNLMMMIRYHQTFQPKGLHKIYRSSVTAYTCVSIKQTIHSKDNEYRYEIF